MTTTRNPSNSRASPSEGGGPALDKKALRAALAGRVPEILADFGADWTEDVGGGLAGCCPVHGGDNKTAFRVYADGQWRCWTQQCHATYGGDPPGLVWGLLVAKDGVDPGFGGALQYCRRLLGKLPTAAADAAEEERFLGVSERLARTAGGSAVMYDLTQVRSRLVIPSPYFLSRKYPADVLSAFHVGDPREDRPGPMRGRAVAPLLHLDGGSVAGFSGRWRGVPAAGSPKWLHQPKGLLRGELLYGWDTAREAVAKTGVVHLVEGCPDVWAWRARGVPNVVGLLGTTLTDAQQSALEASGAVELVLAQDADEAGEAGVRATADRAGCVFRLRRRPPPGGLKDWGDAFEEGLTWAV